MPDMNPRVGVQNNPDGPGVIIARAGRQGELMASELHGRYYEQTYRRNIYIAASQAVATTSVGLSTTYTGLVVSNPTTSVVNMVLLKATTMQSVLQATQVEAYGIATGYNGTTNVTHTTPQAVRNCFIGVGAIGTGLADTSATLPTAPFYSMFVQQTATATANGPGGVIDLEGSIILPPGGYALWVTPGQASVAGMWFSFQWEEVPV